jgi:hyperosmotically inducible protein
MVLLTLVAVPTIFAQNQSGTAPQGLAKEVRHELIMLSDLNVFDNLSFRVNGNDVTLMGEVTKPILKSEAENVTKRIEGVGRVINQIEVLPLSPNDDQVRRATFIALSRQPQLERYFMQSLPPIHIIVKNGNVTLEGVVASKSDAELANIQARTVTGAFSVTNNLRVGQ